MANRLSNSHSPYLKQHENNPVNWQPWDEDTLNQARRENKLMVVSIGYSTCHWCHVMERESFEDERVASVMNKHFISVKVDREENPEIDQIYMTAVQLMKGQGGWPLNCICLPDGRPIYGGTYFPKEEWISTLIQLHEYWLNKPDLAKEFADKLEKGIINTEKIPVIVQNSTFKKEEIKEFIPKWKASFDQTWGGLGHAPKFPMPNDLQFWVEHAFFTQDLEIQTHLIKSLRFMASGGIYDHVGGGFSRYAVDEKWHIPHFEKMLYDNAQLVTVYAKAFRDHPLPLYKRVVQETLNWCVEDLKSENGGYFCALDADSEGVEGKFYTFQKEEFEHLLGEDANLFSEHFNLKEGGNWEEEKTNVLYTLSDSDEIALEAGYTLQEWEETLRSAKNKLKAYRNQRIRPSLDYKQLNSWNCLLLKAYVEAYKTFENEDYQKEALSIQKFIETHLEKQDGSLLRQPALNGKEITGVLEDYAHYIQALIQLYEITSEESFLWKALGYTEYVIEHFLDEDETFFHFTHINSPVLITRKLEVLDNVIPSSNSVMMKNLLTLYKIFDKPIYKEIVYRAMRSILPELKKYPSSYSNWASLFQEIVHGSQEIVLSGNKTGEWKNQVFKTNYPYNLVFSGSKPSEIPLLSNRLSSENRAFVCKNNSCSLPLESKEELLHLLAKDDLKSY